MKIEKNILLCSILALTIGIATITPLAFFMDTAKAQEDTILLITTDDLANMNIPQNITVTHPDGSISTYLIIPYENDDGSGGITAHYSWESGSDIKLPTKESGDR